MAEHYKGGMRTFLHPGGVHLLEHPPEVADILSGRSRGSCKTELTQMLQVTSLSASAPVSSPNVAETKANIKFPN